MTTSSVTCVAMRLLVGVSAGAALVASASAATLDTVKERGRLHCGVSEGLLGFSAAGEDGKWAGFDVDFCRAVAAAVLGDAEKVDYTPLSASKRFEALRAGEIDLLARNSTWTMGREAEFGITLRWRDLLRRSGIHAPALRHHPFGARTRGRKSLRAGRLRPVRTISPTSSSQTTWPTRPS